MTTTSLSLLERASRATDAESWRRLVELYAPLLKRWIGRFDLQAVDTEDVVQEVLMVVARELPKFRHNRRKGAFALKLWDGHFAINEKAQPKQMDWTPLRRSNRDVPSSLAIYQLEGDLLLIVGNTEGPRPTALYSGGGPQRPKTVIFRRAPQARKEHQPTEPYRTGKVREMSYEALLAEVKADNVSKVTFFTDGTVVKLKRPLSRGSNELAFGVRDVKDGKALQELLKEHNVPFRGTPTGRVR